MHGHEQQLRPEHGRAGQLHIDTPGLLVRMNASGLPERGGAVPVRIDTRSLPDRGQIVQVRIDTPSLTERGRVVTMGFIFFTSATASTSPSTSPSVLHLPVLINSI